MNIHKTNGIHVRLEADEHMLSGWLRHNIRLGFSNLHFDRCLKYWGLPKQQLKAQRVNGLVIETILEQIAVDPGTHIGMLNRHTTRRLWLLGAEEEILRKEEAEWVLANNEKNMFAFQMSWKLCPKCLIKDKKLLGFSYWRREHQLPSVAHCVIHEVELLSHHELDHMKRLIMPDKYHQKRILQPAASSVDLSVWSRFVDTVDKLIQQKPSLPSVWRSIVRDLLDLPSPVQQKHRPLFKELLQRLEDDVGEGLMAYLFRAWRDQRKIRPNILWLTLSGMKTHQGIQHPVLWLVIFYWLRHKLPGLQEI